MSQRSVALLEQVLYDQRTTIEGFEGGCLYDTIHVPKIARIVMAKLEQGEKPVEALLGTVNLYRTRTHATPATSGVDALVKAIEGWWAAPAPPLVSDEEERRRRETATAVIKEVFERVYAGCYQGSWLDVNLSDYDIGPEMFLEEIADRFGIPFPPVSGVDDVIEYVLARWDGELAALDPHDP
jgi:hypothetical protein